MAKDSPLKRVEGQAHKAYQQGRQVFIFEAGTRFPTRRGDRSDRGDWLAARARVSRVVVY